jgi:hypothetical protein
VAEQLLALGPLGRVLCDALLQEVFELVRPRVGLLQVGDALRRDEEKSLKKRANQRGLREKAERQQAMGEVSGERGRATEIEIS